MRAAFRCESAPTNADLVYAAAAAPIFDGLKRAAAQIAGLLVLEASGASVAAAAHPMLPMTIELHAQTVDDLRALAPRADRARFHRDHLADVAKFLGAAVAAIREPVRGRLATEQGTKLLKAAWEHLASASSALPGFGLVDLSQSCCAQHASVPAASQRSEILLG